jgi:hypothetical protein
LSSDRADQAKRGIEFNVASLVCCRLGRVLTLFAVRHASGDADSVLDGRALVPLDRREDRVIGRRGNGPRGVVPALLGPLVF